MVALRYLRSPYKPAVLRLITWLSVLGVAAGVATLVIALAMNTGFRETLQDRLLGATAHISLTRAPAGGIHDYRELATRLRSTAGVQSATPAIYETVLLSAGGNARGIVLKGVDPQLEAQANEVLSRRIAGISGSAAQADFSADADGIAAVLLGAALARELGLAPGDYVTLTSPQGRLTPFGMVPRTRRFRVTGIFDSGFYDYDANWGFVTLASAQGLEGAADVAGVVELRIARLEDAPALAESMLASLGPGYKATTWMEQNRALFRALRLEKFVTALFVGLITFVAGLNILVVLAMTVTDKARDIAVLMSMGTRRAQVRSIFLWQGLLIGCIGTAAGLAAGYAAARAADALELVRLDPEVYAVSFVPFHPSLLDAAWIALATLGISLLATLVPARAASRLLPVEILRYE
jgi:lipoprotein-releasing system permease protein